MDSASQENPGEANDQSANAKVFISYSRKDLAFADRIDAGLKERGFTVFIDRDEIYAFEDWWKRIEALIAEADTVVFVLSPDSIASKVALKEVAFAASLNKRFAPIVCRLVDDGAVPDVLEKHNFLFFDDEAQISAGFAGTRNTGRPRGGGRPRIARTACCFAPRRSRTRSVGSPDGRKTRQRRLKKCGFSFTKAGPHPRGAVTSSPAVSAQALSLPWVSQATLSISAVRSNGSLTVPTRPLRTRSTTILGSSATSR
jgi:TIR domain